MVSHFIDEETNEPIKNIEFSAKYQEVRGNVTLGLAESGLSVAEYSIGDDTGGEEKGGGIGSLAIGFIITTTIVSIMFIFLGISYYIRVNNLERKVNALNAGAPISPADEESRARENNMTEAVPNTNLFASKGTANPIFEEDNSEPGPGEIVIRNPLTQRNIHDSKVSELYRGDGDGDDSSLDSGDGIFTGVENQPEFAAYRGHRNEIEFSDDEDEGGSYSSSNVASSPTNGIEMSSRNWSSPYDDTSASRGMNPLYDSDGDSEMI